jgi:3-oxoacyl-[acyl-carrier-protein] synthase-3
VVAHNFGDVRASNPRSDFVPTLAARVKRALGIANPDCVAYDLPFGCPGWLQAVIQVDYFLKSGDATRALVIGAETLSRVSDPHDRNSMIYSDGAGAAVLEARRGPGRVGILAHAARSDALEHSRLMWMGKSFDPGYEDDRLFLKMHGRLLYEYALTTMPSLVRRSLEKAGVELRDVKKVLIHQANSKMDEAILKRLFKTYAVDEIPEGIMPMTIARLGNSSVATIPTLLDLIRRGALEGHKLEAGDIVVFASVGAGMNINSVVYRWA